MHLSPAPKSRPQHGGARTCVGCGGRVPRDRVRLELVRVVLSPDDRPVVDLGGSSASWRSVEPTRRVGRGAWIHARPACLSAGARRGLARSLRTRVVTDGEELARQIALAATRRVEALLSSARRANKAAIGSTAAANASGRLRLLLVARDAAAAAQEAHVAHALNEGRVLVWGDKAGLARSLNWARPVAVIAITDDGLAEALRHAVALSQITAATDLSEGHTSTD